MQGQLPHRGTFQDFIKSNERVLVEFYAFAAEM